MCFFFFKSRQECFEFFEFFFFFEEEKAHLEAILSGGATLPEEITITSKRYQEVQEELDIAELRWLELSEIAE